MAGRRGEHVVMTIEVVAQQKERGAPCDEKVKRGESNTLVIKDNLLHYDFSVGQMRAKLLRQ